MNDDLIASAEIGEEARRFVESELGMCIIGMAEQDKQLALEQLGTINPTDEDGIRELQNKVKLGTMFEQWLVELIDKGNAAMQVFKQQNEE